MERAEVISTYNHTMLFHENLEKNIEDSFQPKAIIHFLEQICCNIGRTWKSSSHLMTSAGAGALGSRWGSLFDCACEGVGGVAWAG